MPDPLKEFMRLVNLGDKVAMENFLVQLSKSEGPDEYTVRDGSGGFSSFENE